MIQSKCLCFILHSFTSKITYPLNRNRTKGAERTYILKIPLSFFARLFSGSAHPRTHILLKSVSRESNTFTSINTDITIFPLTHHTQSQHSHMSLLSLDYIPLLSYNVCFCILCLCLHLLIVMLIDLLIDLLLLTHSLLTFKYTLQL